MVRKGIQESRFLDRLGQVQILWKRVVKGEKAQDFSRAEEAGILGTFPCMDNSPGVLVFTLTWWCSLCLQWSLLTEQAFYFQAWNVERKTYFVAVDVLIFLLCELFIYLFFKRRLYVGVEPHAGPEVRTLR